MPVIIGAENEVPFPREGELRLPIMPTSVPSATTSGLTLPSAVGPIEEKVDRLESRLIEPTVNTPFASAGTDMYFHVLEPSLPAEQIISMPFFAAMEHDIEIGVVSPVRSLYV